MTDPTDTLVERVTFWDRVAVGEPDECWLWLGGRKSKDPRRAYGEVWMDGRKRPAHRVAWELHYGEPFPVGLNACHSCDNPPCVNPRHVFPGSQRDNMQDAVRKGRHDSLKRTHCPRGHEYTPENTRLYRGFRTCAICHRTANLADYHRRKAAQRGA